MHVRRIFFASAFLACALSTLMFVPPSVRAVSTPRVLAFYYAWFDNSTWNSGLTSDLPIQLYSSGDPSAISRHIQQARGAGIDAFVVSWLGPNNLTDTNFKLLLNLAQPTGFAATIDFEVEQYSNRDQVVNALAYVRNNLTNQPAFLRDSNGRPVLFFWREQNFSVADWAAIRSSVDPNHQQVWIAEGVDISYQQVFDGHHLYSIAWSPNVNATLSDWAARVRNAGADKIWVATAMPGYDDTHTNRPDRFARSRGNGDFYRSTWQAAIDSHPDWIVITSFNEWVEGSQIEPASRYGNLYLDLTAQFSKQFKSGLHVAPVSLVIPPASPTPAPTLEADQRLTTDILRVRAGPGTDYEILGRLRSGVTIRISARSGDGAWLQISHSGSLNKGWVAAQYVEPQSGLDAFPVAYAPSPPTATPTTEDQSVPAYSPGQDGGLPFWY